MSEYIKREDATDAFSQMYPSATKSFILDRLAEISAADVEPVVRAGWQDGKCTNCGCFGYQTFDGGNERTAFCPFCGAHMERSGSGE